MSQYTIDELIKTFTKHSEEYEKQKLDFLSLNGSETPFSDFNLPKAFLTILNEINELKDKK